MSVSFPNEPFRPPDDENGESRSSEVIETSKLKTWAMFGGPVLAVIAGLVASSAGVEIGWTVGVVVLCAVWWIFEPIPIPVTSLIPLALFPMSGVLTLNQVAQAYGDKLVLLMMGGFMLSTAMARSGTHRRMALNMVSLFGGSSGGRRLVFGFMATSAILSMWISNAATTLVLLPIIGAVIEKSKDTRLQICLLLGVAYAASIGGIGTPIGTPPNLLFIENYRAAGGQEPTFLTWMSWSFPILVLMLPVAALWLTRGLKSQDGLELPSVGSWRPEEVRTMAVFVITALLWVTRKEPFGGWSGWTGMTGAHDASVALLAVVAMHLIPNGKGETLLTWETAVRIPWGVLILYGGGISIAQAFKSSGLTELIGNSLGVLSTVPVLWMILGICWAVTFLTEVTSNTATATLLLPILGATAGAADIDPKLLMIPATISCSFAFMLPVATPPNAIVFSSEQISVHQMAREGLALNLIGVVIITAICWWQFA